MYPTPKDGVLTDEEYFLILGVEGTADDGVVVGLYVSIVFVLQEALVNDLLRDFSLIDHHVSTPVIDP